MDLVLSMSAKNAEAVSEFFSLNQHFVSKKKERLPKDSAGIFVHYINKGFGIPRYFVKGYDLAF